MLINSGKLRPTFAHLNMNFFRTKPGTLYSKTMRVVVYLAVGVLLGSCGSGTSDEVSKPELALYNDLLERLAWQCHEACSRTDGTTGFSWSKNHADSVKNALKAHAERSILYYQPKLAGGGKASSLGDWLTVEISAWERFFSTFEGITPKELMPSLTLSSALDVSQLSIDYMDLVKIDTAAQTPLEGKTVIRFSKPHYNEEKNRAVIYFEWACGSRNSRGELLMIRFKDDKWLIEERRQVWIRK